MSPTEPDGPGEQPGKGPGGLAPDPCVRNFSDVDHAVYFADAVAQRPGITLAQKTPVNVLDEVNEARAKAGAPPINLRYRELDNAQKPCEWIANMAYWTAYPKGPIKIPDPNHPCAAHWRRIFERVKDQLRSWGLM